MDKQQKVEFIESYIKGVNGSADYQWNDNHGELIRCKDRKLNPKLSKLSNCPCNCSDSYYSWVPDDDWFCADGVKKDG